MDVTVPTLTKRTVLVCGVLFLTVLAGCSGFGPTAQSTTHAPDNTTTTNNSTATVEITDWNGEFTVDLTSVGNADHVFVENQHSSVNVTSNMTGGVFYPTPILESQRGERGVVTDDHFLLSDTSGGEKTRVTLDMTNATVTTDTIQVYAVVDGEERLLREYTANFSREPAVNQTPTASKQLFSE